MHLPIIFSGYSGWSKMTAEQYLELRAVVPSLPEEQSEYGSYETHILTHEAVEIVQKLGLQFRVSDEQLTGVGQMLTKLMDRIDEMELRQASSAELVSKGAAVQIAVPGLGLMAINQVQVLDDCCTDVLQEELNNGWHILAVCPPNAQRRPDYVLGRNEPRES